MKLIAELDFNSVYMGVRKLPAMSPENISYADTIRFKFNRRESHSDKPLVIVNCQDLLYQSEKPNLNVAVQVLVLLKKCTENFQVVLLIERS